MIEITTETDIIKLDSFLKWSGAVSMGSEAKFFIQNGDIIVNGDICTQRGKKLKKGDIIEFNGETYKLV
ncbi:RNA-binding S4 domain-containing protein [Clostridium frigidicarnis]|uniref:Ribosome-associated protein n=1 Tax=Clostridium frigidicarnis TaxID=84698 RepID=A0A1I1B0E3_9CLOT|nr:RNA-binding S4 domain-containing protein [Clostridium frigidicarnis]SFB43829.1 ribosome-associated protein [Clostridium frigidicarnis]